MPTHPDRRFMEAARTEARAALEAGNLPIGAAIVHEDRAVALGRNAIDVPGDDTHHADLVAIESQALLAEYVRRTGLRPHLAASSV